MFKRFRWPTIELELRWTKALSARKRIGKRNGVAGGGRGATESSGDAVPGVECVAV
jgi:hypothetical protein